MRAHYAAHVAALRLPAEVLQQLASEAKQIAHERDTEQAQSAPRRQGSQVLGVESGKALVAFGFILTVSDTSRTRRVHYRFVRS